MEVKADSRQFHEIECDALVVAVFEGEKPDEGALAEINKRSNGVITSLFETGELTGKSGESAYVHNRGGCCCWAWARRKSLPPTTFARWPERRRVRCAARRPEALRFFAAHNCPSARARRPRPKAR